MGFLPPPPNFNKRILGLKKKKVLQKQKPCGAVNEEQNTGLSFNCHTDTDKLTALPRTYLSWPVYSVFQQPRWSILSVSPRYPKAVQDTLVQNVFLTGGNVMYPGMKARIEKELLEMRPFQSSFQVPMLLCVVSCPLFVISSSRWLVMSGDRDSAVCHPLQRVSDRPCL